MRLQSGHHTERDRAVATQDDRQATGQGFALDGVRDCDCYTDDGGDVAGRCGDGVGCEHLAGDVADVGHREPGSPQLVDKSMLAQRRRRQVLSGVVGPCAGWYADDRQLNLHGPMVAPHVLTSPSPIALAAAS